MSVAIHMSSMRRVYKLMLQSDCLNEHVGRILKDCVRIVSQKDHKAEIYLSLSSLYQRVMLPYQH